MSGVTDNYGLILPAAGEPYDVGVTNANNIAVDAEIKKLNDNKIPFGHMGRTNAFQNLAGAGAATVIMDAAQILFGGMTFSNADDALVVPKAGWYRVYIKAFFTGAANETNVAGIKVNGTAVNGPHQASSLQVNKQGGGDVFPHSSGMVQFAAGDKVALYHTSNVSTWGTNGYDGAWLELEFKSAL